MSTASLRQSLTSARSRMRITEAEARRTGAAYASAFVLGRLSVPTASGEPAPLSKLQVLGMPGTVTAAVLAKLGATFMDGSTADYLNGVGDAAAIMALADFARGREVAGMGAAPRAANPEAVEAAIRRKLAAARRDAQRDELLDVLDAAAAE
jgi:hypothetical protein